MSRRGSNHREAVADVHDVQGATVLTLKGKTLFVTGASRGIGKAIALRAARDGANIAVAAKTTEPHPKLPGTIYTAAAQIEAAGGRSEERRVGEECRSRGSPYH